MTVDQGWPTPAAPTPAQSWPQPASPVPEAPVERTSGAAIFWAVLGATIYAFAVAFVAFTTFIATQEELFTVGVLWLLLLSLGVPLLWIVPGVMAARPTKRVAALAWLLWFGPFGLIAVFGSLREGDRPGS